MLLEQKITTKEGVEVYNNLSKKLRDTLDERINSFGKTVRYKFKISSPNPDKTMHSGKAVVWPSIYTLKPAVFTITDDKERKTIALPLGKDEAGRTRFKKIRIIAAAEGNYALDLENADDREIAYFLELHPKMEGGMFADKDKVFVFSRIDEKKLATEKKTERSERVKALTTAQAMSDADVKEFADAMTWDSGQDIDILKNSIEEMAEATPQTFNTLMSGKSVEYRAVVKRALDKNVIGFDPAEWKFIWSSNQQTLTVLSPSEKGEVEQLAEFLMNGGDNAKKAYTTIKSLLK